MNSRSERVFAEQLSDAATRRSRPKKQHPGCLEQPGCCAGELVVDASRSGEAGERAVDTEIGVAEGFDFVAEPVSKVHQQAVVRHFVEPQ